MNTKKIFLKNTDKWLHHIFLAFCIIFLSPGNANSAAIYDESFSGDLNGTQNLSFGVGTNTVSGITTWHDNNSLNDYDSFSFIVGSGELLTSIQIDIINLFPDGTNALGLINWDLYKSNLKLSTQPVPVPSTGLSMFSLLMPLSSGAYSLSQLSLGSNNTGLLGQDEFSKAAYTMTFEVASESEPEPVPEPSTLVLITLGLVGLKKLAEKENI